jgi:TRAP-type mannitol/chloroaromatic compound transport system permease small subunit
LPIDVGPNGGDSLQFLLRISRAIDALNAATGRIATWAVLIASAISAGNAMFRYGFSLSSNAWLEIQWYLFGVMVMLGASYTLNKNEHVRIDILYGNVSMRTQLWIDILGTILFLLPTAAIIGWVSWPLFYKSYAIHEMSSNAGGLLRWPIKLMLPVGFALLFLQGISEIIKRIGALKGVPDLVVKYEKPLQ